MRVVAEVEVGLRHSPAAIDDPYTRHRCNRIPIVPLKPQIALTERRRTERPVPE